MSAYLTYCDEKYSAHDCKEGSLETAHEGHVGVTGFQLKDLGNIRHRFVGCLPSQSVHRRKHTVITLWVIIHLNEYIARFNAYYLIPTSCPVLMIHSSEAKMKSLNSSFWA